MYSLVIARILLLVDRRWKFCVAGWVFVGVVVMLWDGLGDGLDAPRERRRFRGL